VLIATAIAISFLVELGVPNSLQPAYPGGLRRWSHRHWLL